MGISVVEKEDHLLKVKLAFKATDEITDEQAAQIFFNTEITSEEDINILTNYLAQYRPKLQEELNLAVQTK